MQVPVILDSPVWREGSLTPTFVRSSVLFTVPKTDTIDRVACKEPDYNMYLQKGAGDFIRHRLRKRCKIDLNDQSRNQIAAYKGSLTGSLATVDLSSASDSLSLALAHLLLPEDWYQYLSAIRVSTTLIDGEEHYLRMFSSMGNGFTFELESLLFWAICSDAVERSRLSTVDPVLVYGDDIVIPAKAYKVVKRSLNYFGFLVNDDKSFYKGPIRESCGKHYHNGRDITPFYIRKPIKNQMDLIHLLNNFRKWSGLDSTWCNEDHFLFWQKYAKRIDRRLHGGYDLGDTSRLVSYPLRISGAFRLANPKRRRNGDQLGDYRSWLHDAQKRTEVSESSTEHFVQLGNLVIRRVPVVLLYTLPLEVPVWSQEYLS